MSDQVSGQPVHSTPVTHPYKLIIAIDGPAGSGKSTVAKALAREHGFTYLDTGAMYRSVALCSAQKDIDPNDEQALARLAQTIQITFGRDEQGNQTIFVDGNDVTRQIRTPFIDSLVPRVSSVPAVREAMVKVQRELAGKGSVVCEGRDIGTVVFPQAQVKVFLTASAERRAHRRVIQNEQRGMTQTNAIDEASILAGIKERDNIDAHREVSPLKAADDAYTIDTSDLSIEEVIAIINDLIRNVELKEHLQ